MFERGIGLFVPLSFVIMEGVGPCKILLFFRSVIVLAPYTLAALSCLAL